MKFIFRPVRMLYLFTVAAAAAHFFGLGGVVVVVLASLDAVPKDRAKLGEPW